jgi:hypothetical protein
LDGELLQYLDNDLFWDAGDWTWRCGAEVCWWRFAENGGMRVFADEVLVRGREAL